MRKPALQARQDGPRDTIDLGATMPTSRTNPFDPATDSIESIIAGPSGIVREAKDRDHPFARLPQRVINDHELRKRSQTAWSILIYLLSKRDSWQTQETDLTRRDFGERKTVIKAMGVLQEYGYIAQRKRRTLKGTFAYDWWVFEDPSVGRAVQASIASGSRSTAFREPAHLVTTECTNEVSARRQEQSTELDSPDALSRNTDRRTPVQTAAKEQHAVAVATAPAPGGIEQQRRTQGTTIVMRDSRGRLPKGYRTTEQRKEDALMRGRKYEALVRERAETEEKAKRWLAEGRIDERTFRSAIADYDEQIQAILSGPR